MAEAAREIVSAIVPTIGRPASLRRLLESVTAQTFRIDEVLVADGSDGPETEQVIADPAWKAAGLTVRRIRVAPPNAVRQREAAIAVSKGDLLLLLDDDVVLEPACLEEMTRPLRDNTKAVAVMATFSNQSWPQPTRAWRAYLRLVHGLSNGAWQGRVTGPLLRYGYDPVPNGVRPIEWLGTGNSLVRRGAFQKVGGFSPFFLDRSTVNEDVDLALKLSHVGTMLFCPTARMAHHHDPSGRPSPTRAAEDDLYNRYLVIKCTLRRSRMRAFAEVATFFVIETASNVAGALMRGTIRNVLPVAGGRLRALVRILGFRAHLAPGETGRARGAA